MTWEHHSSLALSSEGSYQRAFGELSYTVCICFFSLELRKVDPFGVGREVVLECENFESDFSRPFLFTPPSSFIPCLCPKILRLLFTRLVSLVEDGMVVYYWFPCIVISTQMTSFFFNVKSSFLMHVIWQILQFYILLVREKKIVLLWVGKNPGRICTKVSKISGLGLAGFFFFFL